MPTLILPNFPVLIQKEITQYPSAVAAVQKP